jgi:hypothetical protein
MKQFGNLKTARQKTKKGEKQMQNINDNIQGGGAETP